VVRGGTREVVVEERGIPHHVLWPVARDSTALVGAMCLAALVLGRRATADIDWRDAIAAARHIEECTDLAGGARYRAFYDMLLGVR
jgi:hypothetical protein